MRVVVITALVIRLRVRWHSGCDAIRHGVEGQQPARLGSRNDLGRTKPRSRTQFVDTLLALDILYAAGPADEKAAGQQL